MRSQSYKKSEKNRFARQNCVSDKSVESVIKCKHFYTEIRKGVSNYTFNNLNQLFLLKN